MAATALLGLTQPSTGTLAGVWGDTINNEITALLESAVAGTTPLATDADVTLTSTVSIANQARQAILLFSGPRTALRTITAPAQSKEYVVINATTGGFSVKLVGAGPTTGLTIVNGEKALVAWNGSDFVRVSTIGGPQTSGTIDNMVIGGTTPAAVSGTTGTFSGNVQMASLNGGAVSLRNKIINGAMQASQRNAGSSFNITTTAGYTLDRWQGQTTGATVTGQQAGYANTVGLSSVSNSYSVTGAASNTGVFLIQRIEAKNCRDLAGQSVTLSLRAYVSGAAPTSFNWALRYATATDNFASVTAISNGTFTLTTTDNVYSATISVPALATTGLELLLSTGAFTSGTLFFTNVQLEVGPVATPFEQRPIGMELALCQRYFYAYTCGTSGAGDLGIGYLRGTTSFVTSVKMPVPLRVAPTTLTYSGAVGDYTYQAGGTTCVVNGISIVAFGTDSSSVEFTSATASTVGFGGRVYGSAGARTLYFSGSEL